MSSVSFNLEGEDADRLRELALRAGVSPEDLARETVIRYLRQDPFEFVGAGTSENLKGSIADKLLEAGFAN